MITQFTKPCYKANFTFTARSSRIIRTLSQPLGVVIAVSTIVGIYHTLLEAGLMPEFLPK